MTLRGRTRLLRIAEDLSRLSETLRALVEMEDGLARVMIREASAKKGKSADLAKPPIAAKKRAVGKSAKEKTMRAKAKTKTVAKTAAKKPAKVARKAVRKIARPAAKPVKAVAKKARRA